MHTSTEEEWSATDCHINPVVTQPHIMMILLAGVVTMNRTSWQRLIPYSAPGRGQIQDTLLVARCKMPQFCRPIYVACHTRATHIRLDSASSKTTTAFALRRPLSF
jgi:hypothetical protein